MRSSIESYTHRKWLHVAGCILQSTNLGLLFYYHNGSKQSDKMLLIGDMQMKEIPLHNNDSAPRRVIILDAGVIHLLWSLTGAHSRYDRNESR
jgi:hypothetical protein